MLWRKVEWMARELRWISEGEAIVNWINAMEKVSAMIKVLQDIEIAKPGISLQKPTHDCARFSKQRCYQATDRKVICQPQHCTRKVVRGKRTMKAAKKAVAKRSQQRNLEAKAVAPIEERWAKPKTADKMDKEERLGQPIVAVDNKELELDELSGSKPSLEVEENQAIASGVEGKIVNSVKSGINQKKGEMSECKEGALEK